MSSTSIERVTFACVLRTGGAYNRDWVWALDRGLREYAGDYQLTVLTDDPELRLARSLRVVPFVNDWPGWWSKVELFRRGLFSGRVIYIDLDSLPVGNLSDLKEYNGVFAMLRDFYQPKIAASGVMTWYADECAHLYDAFVKQPPVMQGRLDYWINTQIKPELLQDHFPGQLVSFKAHCRTGAPKDARLVCFHGKPRPNDPKAGWGYHEWAKRANLGGA